MEGIRQRLFEQQDVKYRGFQQKLIPTIAADSIIGVRTPILKKMAKELYRSGDASAFMEELPHSYFDENQLHAFLINEEKDYGTCISRLQEFLPYVDNWATCDQTSPKVFKKHTGELLKEIDQWMDSTHPYTVRFGMGMLMRFYLDDLFRTEYADRVAQVHSDEYYVNMMAAWYFATALAKQYEKILPYFEDRRLDCWTHNKAIQKAAESYRITPEQKAYLRTLKY